MARDRDDDYDDDYDDRPRGRGRARYDDDDDFDDRPRGSPPPNYLVQSILCTLFCCWVFGVIAIVYAAQVDSKWASGDARGAREASANARMWCWWSFWSLLILLVLYVLFIALIAVGGR